MNEEPVTVDGRDAKVEAWLDARHVKWVFDPALAVDAIDTAKSRANQARLEVLDVDVAERYALDMRNGAVFPAVLARSRPRAKRVVLLGGNHRHQAHLDAGHATLPAYVVECEDETATLLMYEDNRRHGLPPSKTERTRQAAHLVAMGWLAKDAAAAVGVTKGDLSRASGVDRATARARALKVGGFDRLPASTRWSLGKANLDPVFTAAARLTTAAGLNTHDVDALIQRANRAPSEAAALAVVAGELEARRAELQRGVGKTGRAAGRNRGSAGTGRTDFDRCRDALLTITALDPAAVAAGAPNADVKAAQRRRIKEATGRLVAVDRALAGKT